jgi:hypothetical protein
MGEQKPCEDTVARAVSEGVVDRFQPVRADRFNTPNVGMERDAGPP